MNASKIIRRDCELRLVDGQERTMSIHWRLEGENRMSQNKG